MPTGTACREFFYCIRRIVKKKQGAISVIFLSMAKLELELSNGNRLFSDKYGVFLVKKLEDMPEIVDGNRTYIQCE